MTASSFLKGRLGISPVPLAHKFRHGLLYLERSDIFVDTGCVKATCAGTAHLPSGEYSIPHQTVSALLLGPGSSITHDALRILAHHDVVVLAIGTNGVRFYSGQPIMRDISELARRQARAWADEELRLHVSRLMYQIRFGGDIPTETKTIEALRGMEGTRIKEYYKLTAQQFGINWSGRNFDRQNPEQADLPNKALNLASTCCEAFAAIAVASLGMIPQLGFVHEESGNAFILDVADMWRTRLTMPIAFKTVAMAQKNPDISMDREIRISFNKNNLRMSIVADMIDTIKVLFK